MKSHFRLVIARTPRPSFINRWRWAVEERQISGEWEFKQDGYAFTRARAAAYAVSKCGYFGVERIEAAVVVGYRPVPPRESKPSPLPPELLVEDGGLAG